jgi:hypothetical protein
MILQFCDSIILLLVKGTAAVALPAFYSHRSGADGRWTGGKRE